MESWTVNVRLHRVASIIDCKGYLFHTFGTLVFLYFCIFGLQPCRNIGRLRLRMVTEEALKALSRKAGRSH